MIILKKHRQPFSKHAVIWHILVLIICLCSVSVSARDFLVESSQISGHVKIFEFRSGAFITNKTFAEITDIFWPGYVGGTWSISGDFDNDGIDEIVVTSNVSDSTFDACDTAPYTFSRLVYIYKYQDGSFFRWKTINPEFTDVRAVWFSTTHCIFYIPSIAMTAGDFDGNGKDELVLSRTTAANQAKVYKLNDSNNIELIQTITNFYFNFPGGMAVASGNFDDDAPAELVTSPIDGEDDIRVLRFENGKFLLNSSDWFAWLFDSYKNYGRGVDVTTGDVDKDGIDELVTGSIAYGDDVRVYKFDNQSKSFNLIDAIWDNYKNYDHGIQVAVCDFEDDQISEIVLAPLIDAIEDVRIFWRINGAYDQTIGGTIQIHGVFGVTVQPGCGSFDGSKMSTPSIMLTSDPSVGFMQYTHPFFEGMILDPRLKIKTMEYQITSAGQAPNPNDWTAAKYCDGPLSNNHAGFSVSAPMLSPGSYRIHFRAKNERDRYSLPRNYAFSVNGWTPAANSQPLAISYNSTALDVFKGNPYNDNNPDDNLNLYKFSGGNWNPVPLTSIDKNAKFVKTMVQDYQANYAVFYRSPACVINSN